VCETLLETLFYFLVSNWDHAYNLKFGAKKCWWKPKQKNHNPFIVHSGLVWNTKCSLILTSWFPKFPSWHMTNPHAHWHVFKCTLHIATCMLPSFWVHIGMVFKCTLHIATCMYWQVVKHGCYFMSQWTWAKEQDRIFKKYSSHVNRIF